MARTPLFETLRRCARLALAAHRRGVPVDEYAGASLDAWLREREFRADRRRFLGRSLALAGAALAAGGARGALAQVMAVGDEPRVAVVGAGIAGLVCAWRLRRGGLEPRVYEGAGRIGGRMLTARGRLAEGQLCELGGELIDSDHVVMHALAKELNIGLDDLFADEPPGFLRDVFHVGGRIVSEAEILAAFGPVALRIDADRRKAEEAETTFAWLDGLSLEAYLDTIPEAAGLIRTLLLTAYTGEYGLEAGDQSAFNLVTLLGTKPAEGFRIFGASDERFHTHAGNDTFITKLAMPLESAIETGMRLVAIRPGNGDSLRLVFDKGGSTLERECDHAVLALPFTLLRQVDIAVELPAEKRQVIRELGYGTNAKLMGQFSSRAWSVRHNSSGSTISDNGVQTLWDTSRGQAGASGILTNFLGGEAGRLSDQGTPDERFRQALPLIDAIYPGTAAGYLERSAIRMHWPTAPWARGSYSCYRPGQWAWHGQEGRRVGNLHFCGEHCSDEFQGFMEGAAETGAGVARAILREVAVPGRG